MKAIWLLGLCCLGLSKIMADVNNTIVVNDVCVACYSSLLSVKDRPEVPSRFSLKICEVRTKAIRKCRRNVSLQGLMRRFQHEDTTGFSAISLVKGFAFIQRLEALPEPLSWAPRLARIAARSLSNQFATPAQTWLARRWQDKRRLLSTEVGGYPDVRDMKELLSLLLSWRALPRETLAQSCEGVGDLKPADGPYADPWSLSMRNAQQNNILCLPVELAASLLPYLRGAFPSTPWLIDLRGALTVNASESWKEAFSHNKKPDPLAFSMPNGAAELATVALYEALSLEKRRREEAPASDPSLQSLEAALNALPFEDEFFATMRGLRKDTSGIEWRGFALKTGQRYASLYNATAQPVTSPLDRLVLHGVGQGAVLVSPSGNTESCSGGDKGASNSWHCILSEKLAAAAGYPYSAYEDDVQQQTKSVNATAEASLNSTMAPPPKKPASCVSDLHRLPIGGGYPATWPLSELLSAWSPDITSLPRHYGRFTSLRAFDASNLEDIEEARHYRRAELPFILRNVASFDRTSELFRDDAFLVSESGDTLYHVDTNADSAHFMYYNENAIKRDGSWEPPTGETLMTMKQWLKAARDVEKHTVEEEQEQLPKGWITPAWSSGENLGLSGRLLRRRTTVVENYRDPRYLREPLSKEDEEEGDYACPLTEETLPPSLFEPPQSVNRLSRSSRTLFYPYANAARDVGAVPSLDWITRRVDVWRYPESENATTGANNNKIKWQKEDPALALATMILPDDRAQTELQMRWGMPRVIAECHFDSGRNWIGMIKGRRRYILAPPTECAKLSILTEGPYRRHSSLDWTSQEDIAKLKQLGAKALEVVLEPGDILYLPPLWFHFIISLETNMQVNSRAGTSPLGGEHIAACNLSFPVSEPLGLHTSLVPPLHHLVALARTSTSSPEEELWSVAEAMSIARRALDSAEMEALHRSVVPVGSLKKGRYGPIEPDDGDPHDSPSMDPTGMQTMNQGGDKDQDGPGTTYTTHADVCETSAGYLSEAQRVPWALAALVLESRPYENISKVVASVFSEQCYLPTPVPEHIFLQMRAQGKA
jgi:Cupin-like domain